MTSVYGKASSLAERRMQPSELLTVKESAGRILYVEDDEDTRELVTCVMTMNNYRIAAAENCHDALMLARSNEFDLYLIDNWMAECSGIDLCEKLREFDPFTPILFIPGQHTNMTNSGRSPLVPRGTWLNQSTTMSY